MTLMMNSFMELPQYKKLVCMLIQNRWPAEVKTEVHADYEHARQLAQLLDKEKVLLLLADVCDWEEKKGKIRLAGGVIFDRNDGWKPKEVYTAEPLSVDIFYDRFSESFGAEIEINRTRYKRMLKRYGSKERVFEEYKKLCELIKRKPKTLRDKGHLIPDYDLLYDVVDSAVYNSNIFTIGAVTTSSWGGKTNEYEYMTKVLENREHRIRSGNFVFYLPQSAVLTFGRFSILFAWRALKRIIQTVKKNSPSAKHMFVVKHDNGSRGHGMIFCNKVSELYKAMIRSLKELEYMKPHLTGKFLVQEYVPLKFTGTETGFEKYKSKPFSIRAISFGNGFDFAYAQIGEEDTETSHGSTFVWIEKGHEFYRYLVPEIIENFEEAIMKFNQKKHRGRRMPNASIWPIGFDFGIAQLENPKRTALVYLESNNRPFLSRLQQFGKLELYSQKIAEYILEQLRQHHTFRLW